MMHRLVLLALALQRASAFLRVEPLQRRTTRIQWADDPFFPESLVGDVESDSVSNNEVSSEPEDPDLHALECAKALEWAMATNNTQRIEELQQLMTEAVMQHPDSIYQEALQNGDWEKAREARRNVPRFHWHGLWISSETKLLVNVSYSDDVMIATHVSGPESGKTAFWADLSRRDFEGQARVLAGSEVRIAEGSLDTTDTNTWSWKDLYRLTMNFVRPTPQQVMEHLSVEIHKKHGQERNLRHVRRSWRLPLDESFQ